MADYGHDLSFGIFVTPRADAGPHVLELAQRADAAGLDWVSVQDHPYQPAFLDAWTLLTAIAASTSRIGVSSYSPIGVTEEKVGSLVKRWLPPGGLRLSRRCPVPAMEEVVAACISAPGPSSV
jgi:hypothetical protein